MAAWVDMPDLQDGYDAVNSFSIQLPRIDVGNDPDVLLGAVANASSSSWSEPVHAGSSHYCLVALTEQRVTITAGQQLVVDCSVDIQPTWDGTTGFTTAKPYLAISWIRDPGVDGYGTTHPQNNVVWSRVRRSISSGDSTTHHLTGYVDFITAPDEYLIKVALVLPGRGSGGASGDGIAWNVSNFEARYKVNTPTMVLSGELTDADGIPAASYLPGDTWYFQGEVTDLVDFDYIGNIGLNAPTIPSFDTTGLQYFNPWEVKDPGDTDWRSASTGDGWVPQIGSQFRVHRDIPISTSTPTDLDLELVFFFACTGIPLGGDDQYGDAYLVHIPPLNRASFVWPSNNIADTAVVSPWGSIFSSLAFTEVEVSVGGDWEATGTLILNAAIDWHSPKITITQGSNTYLGGALFEFVGVGFSGPWGTGINIPLDDLPTGGYVFQVRVTGTAAAASDLAQMVLSFSANEVPPTVIMDDALRIVDLMEATMVSTLAFDQSTVEPGADYTASGSLVVGGSAALGVEFSTEVRATELGDLIQMVVGDGVVLNGGAPGDNPTTTIDGGTPSEAPESTYTGRTPDLPSGHTATFEIPASGVEVALEDAMVSHDAGFPVGPNLLPGTYGLLLSGTAGGPLQGARLRVLITATNVEES